MTPRAHDQTFARWAYEIGKERKTGTLVVRGAERRFEARVLEGAVILEENDPLGRRAQDALSALARDPGHRRSLCRSAVLVSVPVRALSLIDWSRQHVTRTMTPDRAAELTERFASSRVAIDAGAVVSVGPLDRADACIVAALRSPRSLSEVATIARAPRFRVLAWVDFLDGVGCLRVGHVAREEARPVEAPAPERRARALSVLGLPADAPRDLVKSAFRRLAKAFHPDLHPDAPEAKKRELALRLAGVTAAYAALTEA